LAVRAVDRAALGSAVVPPAPAAGANKAGGGRLPEFGPGGGADPRLHLGGGRLRTRRPAAACRRSQPVPAPCLDRIDHVGAVATLLLSAEPMAATGTGRAAGAHRGAAGAHPP